MINDRGIFFFIINIVCEKSLKRGIFFNLVLTDCIYEMKRGNLATGSLPYSFLKVARDRLCQINCLIDRASHIWPLVAPWKHWVDKNLTAGNQNTQ